MEKGQKGKKGKRGRDNGKKQATGETEEARNRGREEGRK